MEHLARAAADGVDEDVDAPEGRTRRRDDSIGVGLAGGIPGDREALGAGGSDAGDGSLERVGGAAGDHDLRARPGHRLGQRGADRAAAARDEGDAALEAEDVELPHPAPSHLIDDRAYRRGATRRNDGTVRRGVAENDYYRRDDAAEKWT